MTRTLLLLLLLLVAQLEAMNAMNDIGVGAKAKGMGGVGVALPQDALVAAMNPAGMALVGNRFDIGAGWVWQNGTTTLRDTGEGLRTHQPLWFPEVGFAWEFCPCQTIGLTIWVNGSLFTHYPTANRSLGTTPVRFDFSQAVLAPSWAWRIDSIHSVGIAVNIVIGWLETDGLQTFAIFSEFPNEVTNLGIAYEPGYALHFGWVGRFCPWFFLGASFQTETWMCRFFRYQGLFPRGGRVNLPPTAAIGISSRFYVGWTASADLLFRLWTQVNTFNSTRRRGGLFGSAEGPGFGWNNQAIVKLGLAWDILPTVTLRGGYNYGNNPIPPTETLLNQLTLATLEHNLTFGGTWKHLCHEITLYAYYAFHRPLRGGNLIEVELSNRQFSAGFSYGRRF